MNVTSLIIKALGGSITGYITNDLAIKMLFKKYGPLGGVILETKEDFIKNTSELVEREIINHQTIEGELAKDEFKDVFEDIIEDILEEYLYQNTEDDIRLIDIPELDNSSSNFIQFYKANNQKFITTTLNLLLDSIKVEDLLGDKQIEYISNQFLDILINILKDRTTIENLVSDLYGEHQDQEVSHFISSSIFKQIASNLKDSTTDFHKQLEIKFDSKIDRTINNLYNKLEVSSILEEVERKIKNRSLADLLGKDNTYNIANQLLEKTVNFLKSSDGKQLITRFLEEILKVLKEVDLSLLELLNDNLKGNLEYFMEDELPDLIEQGIRWIKTNKREIEDLIEEAAQETLAGGSGVKNWIKKQLKDIFMSNIGRQFKIVDKIVTGIEQEVDIRELSTEVSQQILNYIKNNSIGEIIGYLEDKNLIKIEEIIGLLDRNIDQLVSKLDLTEFDKLFEISLGQVINIELKDYFEDNIKDMLIKKFKGRFLYTRRLTKALQGEIYNRVLEIVNLSLKDLISMEIIEDNLEVIKKEVLTEINNNRAEISNRITEGISSFISNKQVSDLITEEIKNDISTEFGKSSTYYLEDQIVTLKYQQVTEVYDRLNQKQDLITNLTALILELVNQNLSNMIEGKIEGAVANNLSKLPDQQIQNMVEQFMGKELKPITLFGSLLGFGAAIGLYFGQEVISGSIPAGIQFVLSVFAYGAVGYLTNVIALKMIFRPYDKKEFLGLKLPFTPGVITKRKPSFADSMANFVDKDLLNANAVDEIFKSKRAELEVSLKETVSNNDYRMLQQILEDNQDFIVVRSFTGLLNLVGDKKEEIITELSNKLTEIDLARLDSSNLEVEVKERSKEALLNSHDLLQSYLVKLLGSNQTLNDLLPNSIKKELRVELDKLVHHNIQQVLEFIGDEDRIDSLVKSYAEEFDQILDDQLGNLISQERQQELRNFAKDYFLDKIRSSKVRGQILDLIEDKFLKEVHPDQKISQIFDGSLMEAVHSNKDFIINLLFNKAVDYLQAERSNFKEKVIDKIDESIADEKSSGGLGWLTGTIKNLTRNATDADDTVEDVIDNLIDYKFPKFLKEKEDELRGVFNKFLSYIGRKRVGEIGIDLDRQGIDNLVENLVENQMLVNHLTTLLEGTINSVLEVKLKSLLKIVSITNLVDIVNIFATEINSLRYGLVDRLYSKEELVIEEVGELLEDIFGGLVLSIRINELSSGIKDEAISKSVRRILNAINDSQAWNRYLEVVIKDLITEIQFQKLDQILEINYLKDDLEITLEKLLENSKVQEDLLQLLIEVIEVLVSNSNDIIEQDTKDFILDLGLKSFLDSMEDHFLDLTNSVNIKEITKQEINEMHPREIEDLFNSFASHYFKKLEHYGWLGAGVGSIAEIIALLG